MLRLRVITIALIGLAAASASAKEPWQLKWIEVRSPHFVVASAVSEKQSVDLIKDLERFRAAVQMVTNIGRFEERIPTKVYVLPHAVEALGFDGDVAGYFRADMRANYAALIPASSAGLDDILKHEYVHFLVHNRDTLDYPSWFDEGFAGVFETLTAREGRIDYGQPSQSDVDWLGNEMWMSFNEILDTRDTSKLNDSRTAMFYAQSWLLMHYLMLARPGRDFGADATAFLQHVESGDKSSVAFERAFGMPVVKLRNTLIKYIAGDLRVMRLTNQNLPDVQAQVVAVAADTIASELALLPFKRRDYSEAKRYWDAAIALNPNNTLALVGLGDCLKHEDRFDEAPPYYEKAIALEPQNPYPELDYAEYFYDRARQAKDKTEVANLLVEARHHFARSYKLDPNIPETLAMNGATYLLDGQSADKALESLKAAHAMLPSQPSIKFLLAQAYAKSGQPDRATPLLRSLVAWGQIDAAEAAKALEEMSKEESADEGTSATAGQPQ